jgi:outer membrane translocation and assembly module TamA
MVLATLLLGACSTTKNIPDGDQLFTGLAKTEYNVPVRDAHFTSTQAEIDAALATAPNGALFGSSSVRSPFQVGLWVWNAFSGSNDGFSKWMLSSFGSRPVLISWVNPALRASVAQEVLRVHGYFRGTVGYDILQQHNTKKAKIKYTVNTGPLWTVDTLTYQGFPPQADSLIRHSAEKALIRKGDAFDVNTLEAERKRVSTLMRDSGFFYYQPTYASWLVDSVSVPGKVILRLQLAEQTPQVAKRKWSIGKLDIELHKDYGDSLLNSETRRALTVHYNGKRSPLRVPVILGSNRLFPGQTYSYTEYQAGLSNLSSTGLFSTVDVNFTPRDTTGRADTLDMRMNLVFDKPYDIYFEGNVTGKTNNRFGPGAVLGITRRNAFRGGELLDLKLKGNYEWQTAHHGEGNSSKFNSYEYGADLSLQLPRMVIPFASYFRKKLISHYRRIGFFSTPSTTLKFSTDILNRAGFFKRRIVSGEWTYDLQTSPTSKHQFTPLSFSYEYMKRRTAAFDSVLQANPYLAYTMRDQFIPKMQYVYTYTSPKTYRNPLWWQTTISESGNILSLGEMVVGNKWSEKNKELFKNPYAQFFKLETEVVKTWQLTEHSSLVAHGDVGMLWAYGNSNEAPYSEQFYVGGANSIRAFTVRSIGPGSYHNAASATNNYLDQTGDLKLLANLEYRPRLFGNLYGALFLDAGNVWSLHNDERAGGHFEIKNVLKETALGTGVGLRYDMDFLVIRVDWGVGLHVPYKSGFYNVGSFSDSQSLHFAIGYPF